LAWTVPTAKKDCVIVAQPLVKNARENSLKGVFTYAHAAQFATGKKR
jgi:hypothetical protein